MASKKTLEERLKAIEDTFEIMRLKSHYLTACDGGWSGPSHDCDRVAELFTEDGVWDPSPVTPVAEGREAIREIIKAHRSVPFAMHHVSNPDIKVSGDTAIGRWNLILMLTSAQGQAYWITAVYQDKYIRTPSGWRFKKLKATVNMYAPYELGWAKSSVPTTNNLDQLTRGKE